MLQSHFIILHIKFIIYSIVQVLPFVEMFFCPHAPLLQIFTAGGLFSKCKNKTYNCLLIICKQLNKSLYVSLWVVIFYSLFLTIFDNFFEITTLTLIFLTTFFPSESYPVSIWPHHGLPYRLNPALLSKWFMKKYASWLRLFIF